MHRTLAAFLLIAGGCASSLPEEKAGATQLAIQNAAAAGAETDPNAAVSLNRARKELAEAEDIGNDGDEGAPGLADRALADAQLAQAQARMTPAQKDAAQAKQRFQALRNTTEKSR